MEITDPASAPTCSFPFVLECHQFYELMVDQGEGRSPTTSLDAETDSKPIIIIITIKYFTFESISGTHSQWQSITHNDGVTRQHCSQTWQAA